MALIALLQQIPLVIILSILVISLLIIIKAAEYMVYAMKGYGDKFGLSEEFLGLFVVGTALAAPAIISSVTGIFLDDAEIALGSILGSNLLTFGFLLAMSGFNYKALSIKSKLFSKSLFFTWGLITLPLILILDGSLGRIDGIALLACFGLYIKYVWKIEKSIEKPKKNVAVTSFWKPALTFIIAFAALLLSTNWLVFSASVLARTFNFPSYFAAVTIVSIGAALPSFAIRFKAKEEGHSEFAMGTYIGRLLITFVLFFGLVGLFSPVAVQASKTVFASIFMLIFVTILFAAQKKQAIARFAGMALLVLYFVFIALEALKAYLGVI